VGGNQRGAIAMSAAEVQQFLATSRTLVVATQGVDQQPHLVAMWFAPIDGDVWFATKAKSQKITNLQRNPRITCLAEDGEEYSQLRGVAIEGVAEISDDPDLLWRVGVCLWERYNGAYQEGLRATVESTLKNRVAVRVRAQRVRSWDHAKLS
jgi:PPOX class probable F420-dependent enzyme